MARKNRGQRDNSYSPSISLTQLLATPYRPYPMVSPLSVNPSPQEVLSHVPDRRLFSPVKATPVAHSVPRSASRLRAVPFYSPAVATFDDPRAIGICVRRKARKAVLFALSLTGKGSRSKRRRNVWSSYKC